ncbi:MAG: RNA polymerase sigma factor [Clostridia bacterium]|nr:RNA polymerase sigma factor [Clostridia bacterium]
MDNGASSYRRYLSGDDSALSDIVRDYQSGLTLYLNGFVNNIYLAEELMEDTFFKLITKKPRFSEKYSFKTWLYTIGRNVAIDYIRCASRHKAVSYEQLSDALCDEYDLERSYIVSEEKVAVHRAIKRLSPDYHQVLWLSFFEGMTNKEAAKIMKKTPGQIKNLIYRAKNALKNELEKEDFVYEGL